MRPRLLSAVVVSAVVAVVVTTAPSQAGPPGTWTVISGGGVTNIDEPSMYSTADGVLHVAMVRGNPSTDSIDVAHVSPSGKLLGRQAVVDNWSGLTEDPDFVPGAAGGIRMVFGGLTGSTGDPYAEGYVYQTSSDATGTVWTLAPNTQPAIADVGGYASYGTGSATLADGTLVSAYPLNSAIYYQVGAGPVGSFSVDVCCAYDMAVATDGVNAWASWYGNGGSGASNEGTLVRQIHPVLGPIVRAPQSVSGSDSLGTSQAVGMVSTKNGIYLAYLKGYPTAKAVVLWKLGTSSVQVVPDSAGASHVALAAGPGGRLWLAWDTPDDNVRTVRTSPDGKTFGAVQEASTPGSSTVYGVNIEGSVGTGDIVFNDGSKIWHTQVLPGLTVEATPGKWNGDKSVEVKFKVTDAGDGVAGAKVKILGEKCTTAGNGVCKIDLPKLAPGKYKAKATKEDYAAGKVKLKVG